MTKESAIRVLKSFRNENIIEMSNHNSSILTKEAFKQIALHGYKFELLIPSNKNKLPHIGAA